MDSEFLRAVVEKNPGNPVRYHTKEISVSQTTISQYLKFIGNVKKNKWVPREFNQNHKRKRLKSCLPFFFATKMILSSI